MSGLLLLEDGQRLVLGDGRVGDRLGLEDDLSACVSAASAKVSYADIVSLRGA